MEFVIKQNKIGNTLIRSTRAHAKLPDKKTKEKLPQFENNMNRYTMFYFIKKIFSGTKVTDKSRHIHINVYANINKNKKANDCNVCICYHTLININIKRVI